MLKTDVAQNGQIALTEVRLLGLLVAGCAYWGNVIWTGWDTDLQVMVAILHCIIDNGAFSVAAWILIALLATKATPGVRRSGSTSAATIAACVPAALPSGQTLMLTLLDLAVQWFWFPHTRAGRAVALLLFSLAGDIFWASSYLLPLHAAIGVFDATMVQLAVQIASRWAVAAALHTLGLRERTAPKEDLLVLIPPS